MPLKIPKRFKLLGRTIEVTHDPHLLHDRNWYGCADYTEDLIVLVPVGPAYKATREKYEQTFCHELMHHLLFHGGSAVNHALKEYVHKNEEFVDLMGSLLHQALTTMEYEEE